MADCLFCDIADKKIPSTSVFENEYIYAFDDITPQAPVHVVIIPKKHIVDIADIKKSDVEIISDLMLHVSGIAEMKGVLDAGFRVVSNKGSDGGQSVDHLHFHLLGGRQMGWPPG